MDESTQGAAASAAQVPPTTVTPPVTEAPTPASETVTKADVERVLKDMHKYKSLAQKLQEQAESEKLARMKEQNQWREIAESKEREAAEAKAEAENTRKSYINGQKFSAFSAAADAIGLRPEARSDLELIDLEAIQIESTSTGKINVLGVDKVAEQLKRQKPHWFLEKQPPNVNAANQRVHDNTGTITEDMLFAAEKEAKKTGNMSQYVGLHKQYREQQQRLRSVR